MKKIFKTIFVVFSLLAVVIAFAACKSAQPEKAQEPVKQESKKVVIGYQKGNTVNILKARGNLDERLKKEGYIAEWKVLPIGTVLLEALYTNNIDFGHASDANSVFSQASGKDITYIASETPYPKGVALIAKKESGIRSPEDLKGKKVGVTKGGNMHYLLLKALQKVGLTDADVKTIYYADAAQGLAAFKSGELDVLGTWDPFLAIIQKDIETVTVVDGTNLTENRTFYFASQQALKKDPKVIKIILEELQNSDLWVNTHKKEVAEILAKELGIDSEALLVANNRRDFGVLKIDEKAIKSQQDLADTFYGIKLFPNKINIKDAVKENPDWLPNNVK